MTGHPPDIDVVRSALVAAGVDDVSLHLFATLDSTNAWLARGEGRDVNGRALCATDHQPAGSGRRGRGWEAGPGNLTFSLRDTLDVPFAHGGQVSLVTGVALCRALRELADLPVMIKWPNDLWLDDSKLGGLLHEARHDGTTGLRIVAGIGINMCDESHHDTIGATSLEAHGVVPSGRDALLGALAARVFDAWDAFARAGWATVASDWVRFDALCDREVGVYESVTRAGGGGQDGADWHGVARGVDAQGALIVETATGRRTVHAADVSVRAARATAR